MLERDGPRPSGLRLACLLLLFLVPVAGAAGGIGTGPQGPIDLGGHVTATWSFSTVTGGGVAWQGGDGVMHGFTVGAALSMRAGGYHIGLDMPYIGPGRQNVTVNVRSDAWTAALTYRNIPPAVLAGERRAEFSLRQTLRLDGMPDIAIDFARRATGARTSLSAGITLSDRYRDLSPALRSLNWQAGYRVAAAAVPNHSLQFTVGGQLAAPDSSISFNLRSRYRWTGGDDARLGQNYLLSVAGGPESRDETLTFSIEAEPAGTQPALLKAALDYTTGEFGPVDVILGVSAQQGRGGAGADYRVGLGWDVSETVAATAGYHGVYRSTGASNGAELGVSWRLNARPWLINTSVSTSLQFPTAGGFTPTGRASLGIRYQGESLSFSAMGSLTYAGQGLRGRVETSTELFFGRGGISLDAGLQLARDTSVNLGLGGHVRVWNSLSLTGNAGWRASFGEDFSSVFTLGLGLRYEIGGAG